MKIRCPSCGAVHQLSFELVPGYHVECPCGTRFEVGPDTTVDGRGTIVDDADAELEEGVLVGRCRIERLLGKGTMGDVYLARHMTLDIPVALKVLRSRLARQEEFKKRFYREARTAAQLDHPNVVRVLDCGEDDGVLYLVMEYMERGTVRDILERRKSPLPTEDVMEIGIAACRALEAAWNHGIVHRDVKPDNIMISANGTYKLADLGLAREMISGESGVTIRFTGLGTPHYMAPEQAFDAGTCDIRADIYSLGSALYHVACGRPPFTGDSTVEVLRLHARSTCLSPSHINPDLNKRFDEVLGRAMMKHPDRRYQLPRDMLADLTDLQATLRKGGQAVVPVRLLALAAVLVGVIGVLLGLQLGRRNAAAVPGEAQTDASGTQSLSPAHNRANAAVRLTVGQVTRGTSRESIFLELSATPSERSEKLSDGVLRFQGAVYDLVPNGEGGLRFSLPDLAVFPAASTAEVQVFDPFGHPAKFVFTIPQQPARTLRPLAPNILLNEADAVRLRWTPLQPGEDLPEGMSEQRVQIGWLSARGEWTADTALQTSPEVGALDIPRETFAQMLRDKPGNTPLIVRYSIRDLRDLGDGAAMELVVATEQRFELHHEILRYPMLEKELRKWFTVVTEDGLPKEDKQRFTRHMVSVLGRDCLDDMLDFVFFDHGEACYWAAYTLAVLADGESVSEVFEERLPNEFERRRAILRLRQKRSRHPDEFPPEFRAAQSLGDTTSSLRRPRWRNAPLPEPEGVDR